MSKALRLGAGRRRAVRIGGQALSSNGGGINFMRLCVGIVALEASQSTMVTRRPCAIAFLVSELASITRLRWFLRPRSILRFGTHWRLRLSFE